MPGRSGTSFTVILASSRLNATPEITAFSIAMCGSSSKVMSVPDCASSATGTAGSVRLESTRGRHPVLAGELDRADLQHLGAQRRQLQHLLEADGAQARASGTMLGSVV